MRPTIGDTVDFFSGMMCELNTYEKIQNYLVPLICEKINPICKVEFTPNNPHTILQKMKFIVEDRITETHYTDFILNFIDGVSNELNNLIESNNWGGFKIEISDIQISPKLISPQNNQSYQAVMIKYRRIIE